MVAHNYADAGTGLFKLVSRQMIWGLLLSPCMNMVSEMADDVHRGEAGPAGACLRRENQLAAGHCAATGRRSPPPPSSRDALFWRALLFAGRYGAGGAPRCNSSMAGSLFWASQTWRRPINAIPNTGMRALYYYWRKKVVKRVL